MTTGPAFGFTPRSFPSNPPDPLRLQQASRVFMNNPMQQRGGPSTIQSIYGQPTPNRDAVRIQNEVRQRQLKELALIEERNKQEKQRSKVRAELPKPVSAKQERKQMREEDEIQQAIREIETTYLRPSEPQVTINEPMKISKMIEPTPRAKRAPPPFNPPTRPPPMMSPPRPPQEDPTSISYMIRNVRREQGTGRERLSGQDKMEGADLYEAVKLL